MKILFVRIQRETIMHGWEFTMKILWVIIHRANIMWMSIHRANIIMGEHSLWKQYVGWEFTVKKLWVSIHREE